MNRVSACLSLLSYFHNIQWFYEPHFMDEKAKSQNNEVDSCPRLYSYKDILTQNLVFLVWNYRHNQVKLVSLYENKWSLFQGAIMMIEAGDM